METFKEIGRLIGLILLSLALVTGIVYVQLLNVFISAFETTQGRPINRTTEVPIKIVSFQNRKPV